MKALIAATAAVAAAVALAPAAHADNAELAYLQTLNAFGMDVYNTAAALNTGYAICGELEHRRGTDVARELYTTTTYADVPTLDHAAAVVLAASANLCPWIYGA